MKVRNLEIGSGRPKICAPVTGKDREAVYSQVREIVQAPVDMIEWRADMMEPFPDSAAIQETAKGIREIAGDRPVLFTVRTKAEGGSADPDEETYEQACRSAVLSGAIDLLDIEIMSHGGSADVIRSFAQDNGVRVVFSNHNFTSTPSAEILFRLFAYMNAHDGDILKIAVMPQTRSDVMNLLDASYAAWERFGKPIIAISMGRLGLLSRISGGITGSAVTFASVGEGSAPGQIPADEMARILKMLDGE